MFLAEFLFLQFLFPLFEQSTDKIFGDQVAFFQEFFVILLVFQNEGSACQLGGYFFCQLSKSISVNFLPDLTYCEREAIYAVIRWAVFTN